MVWLQTHIPSILVSCPSHSCPTGPCCREGGTNETRGRQRGVKVLLDPTVLPPATLVVYGCVWSPSLPVCVHACILTGSSFARKTSLRRPAACRHSSRGVRMLFPPNEVMTSCLRVDGCSPVAQLGSGGTITGHTLLRRRCVTATQGLISVELLGEVLSLNVEALLLLTLKKPHFPAKAQPLCSRWPRLTLTASDWTSDGRIRTTGGLFTHFRDQSWSLGRPASLHIQTFG